MKTDRPAVPPTPAEPPAWREDFPIDWPQDQYVERRDFVKFLVLTSGALAVGQLWIGLQSMWRKWSGAAPKVRIAGANDIVVGGALAFRYPTEHDPCLLVRVAGAEFVAFSQTCTHLSCAVIPRPEENIFLCPCHEGRFDLRTGVPVAGPPQRPLPRIDLEMRRDGIYAVGVTRRMS
jgi:nitrite reductase/ring-hydroxylating ferredoxin subunit